MTVGYVNSHDQSGRLAERQNKPGSLGSGYLGMAMMIKMLMSL